MELALTTNVVQITNIAPSVTLDQLNTMFGYLGKIQDIKLYATELYSGTATPSRICYIRFQDSACVKLAQHMTNTVFIDRALIVVPVAENEIPSEAKAVQLANPMPSSLNTRLDTQILPVGPGGTQMITSFDPVLSGLGLPPYPPLPVAIETHKLEEIRRTVYVTNLLTKVTSDQLLKFFNALGEVKYLRMSGEDKATSLSAYVEFSEQTSVAAALQEDGKEFAGQPIRICHSTQSIEKPQLKGSEAAQKEIEEAMKRAKDAEHYISSSIDPRKKRSRSRSRRRTRSRSPRRRRTRSRSPRRKKSRSRSPVRVVPRRRSRSRERSRRSRSPRDKRVVKRSRSRHRSRSRDKRGKRPSKSKSPILPPSKKSSKRSSHEGSKKKELKPKEVPSKENSPQCSTNLPDSRSPSKHSSKSPPPVLVARSPTPPVRSRSISGSPKRRKKSLSRHRSPKKLSPSPPRRGSKKRRSRSPVIRHKRPRSRSLTGSSWRKSGSPRRSKSPFPPRRKSRSPRRTKVSRSRSRSPRIRHKKKKERDHSHERRRRRDDDSNRVVRDYDEEEKGFDNGQKSPKSSNRVVDDRASVGSDNMELDSD